MRLLTAEIRDYRSIFVDDSGQPLRLDFAAGSNTLVGKNNCGKSNVLRAVALALDPRQPYDPEADRPGPKPYANPVITLTFEADGQAAQDADAVAAIDVFEQRLHGGTGDPSLMSMASRRFGLEVSFVPTGAGVRRKERLLLPGAGKATLTDEASAAQTDAITAVRHAVRFVLISTGESIESVLEGNFREILHSVVRDRLENEFKLAEEARQQYVTGLQDSLLAPLRTRLADDVRGLFPEIDGLALAPEVSSIEQTLSKVGVSLDDVVTTPLSRKGTGVRGGVLVAMLRYLANNATRSMVFAVEEPEAFLHPAAQENLRDHLEQVATVNGVTLITSTHSPFIVSRAPLGRVFCLAKDTEGRTRVAQSAAGDADHAPLIGGLLRQSSLDEVLAAASAIPSDVEAVVLLEGEGDQFCIELAVGLVGRHDLLDHLALVPTGGTQKMIAQAVITKAATDAWVLVVVDNDDPGRAVKDKLVGSTFGFGKKQVLNYSVAFDEPQWNDFPTEAEDLFAPELLARFVAEHGDSIVDGTKKRPDGAWHYDLDQSAKELLKDWLRAETRATDVERWIRMLLAIRKAAKLMLPDESAADIVAAAPAAGYGTSAKTAAGDVLVLAGQLFHDAYTRDSALVLPDSIEWGAGVTHVGFYHRAILTVVPEVEVEIPNLLLDAPTIDELRSTGRTTDKLVAEFVKRVIQTSDELRGTTARVVLLTPPEDERTLHLSAPIENTKRINDRPVAWTIGPRIVPYAALAAGPAGTSDLDHLVQRLQEDRL